MKYSSQKEFSISLFILDRNMFLNDLDKTIV